MNYQVDISDYIGSWGCSKNYVKSVLAGYKGKPVNVRIASLGGEVAHGLDIRQQFIDHGQVTAYLYGMVASSATIAALGAQKICISRYCLFLVHKVSNWVDEWGQMNADQIRELIDKLKANAETNDKFDLVLAQMYADKCKKKISDILDILKKGAWMTAQEAKDLGFVDEVIDDPEEDKLNFARMAPKLNYLNQLPAVPEDKMTIPEPRSLKEEIKNAIQSVMTDFKNSFAKNNDAKEDEEEDVLKPIIMNKSYIKINELLGVEGFDIQDEKTSVTEEQLEKLNSKMEEDEKALAKKEEEITALKEQVKNLQASAGETSAPAEEGEKEMTSFDAIKKAQEMYDML